MKRLSGKSSFAVYQALRELVKGMRRIDGRRYEWSLDAINIGIIGEIFTCCEERVNYDIERRLREMEVNPYNSANLSEFIDDDSGALFLFPLSVFSRKSEKRKYMEDAAKFLNGPLGGHGIENIGSLLWMKDKGVDGVVHLLPLSCMPEATVEPIINSICQEANIPLLRILIDETNSSTNIETRVETFVELIKRKNRLNTKG
jgi:predicted nucleotide-binding protein (sugar kinase/HSP70/actin superfamily)